MINPWKHYADRLASWTRDHLVVRDDAHGRYRTKEEQSPGRVAYTSKTSPTDNLLNSHFAGEITLGLHTTDDRDRCLWGLIDQDNHDGKGDREAIERAVITWHQLALSLGIASILEDSDGRGSHKLWLLFRERVEARVLRRLLGWITKDWAALGMRACPELFPKQDGLNGEGLGSWVRIFGRHPKHEHTTRVRDGDRWLEGEEAILVILATEGSPRSTIPDEFRHEPPQPAGHPSPPMTCMVNATSIPVGLVRSALDALPISFFGTYEIWLQLGMILFGLGDEGLRFWEGYSRKCPKYRAGACREKWDTFRPGGLTYRTLFRWAMRFGWSPRAKKPVRTMTSASVQVGQDEIPDVQSAKNPDQPTPPIVADGQGESPPENNVSPGEDGQGPPDGKQGQQPPSGNPKRPQIFWEDRPPPDVTDDALASYEASSYQKRLFVKGGALVRMRRTEEGPRTEELSKEALRGVLFRVADWLVVDGRDKQGNPINKITPPPWFVVDDILTLPEWDPDIFPYLNGIVRSPVIAPDGSLVASPGYHKSSRLYYEPDPKLTIPAIPEHPSDDDIARAKSLILGDLFFDFPFKEPADKANAVAYLLTPFVRSLIKGPTPMGIIDAPVQGTGKGLLALCIGIVAAGEVRATPMPTAKEEWQKTITALLVSSAQVVLFDNMTGVLYSPDLAAALTAEVWSARLITTPEMVNLPVTCTWLGTANNVEAKEDMPRRIVFIRLDAGLEKPDEREPGSFRHKDLLSWARVHRGELIWAALVLVRAWLSQGRPDGPQNMGSYESWSRTLGGILQVVGVPGFLGTQQARRKTSDSDSALWRAFTNAWYDKFAGSIKGVKELFEVVEAGDLLPGVLNADTELGRRQQFGNRLKERIDRIYGDKKIGYAGDDNSGRKLYKLEIVGGNGGSPGSPRPPDALPPLPTPPVIDPADEAPYIWSVPDEEVASQLFHLQLEARMMHRSYLDNRSAQILDFSHAIFRCRASWRLITGSALVRFARSRGLLAGILTAQDEDLRIGQLSECFQEANFYCDGLAQISLEDTPSFDGRTVCRYAIRDLTDDEFDPILQPDDLVASSSEGVQGDQEAQQEPFDFNAYFASAGYETLVAFCRCWWETEDHVLDFAGVLDLVHRFDLLPDFAEVYDYQTQAREIHFILYGICGFEFEGFLIGWPAYDVADNTGAEQELPIRFDIRIIEGSPPPRIPPNGVDLWTRRRNEKPYRFTGRDLDRLCFGRK